MPYTITRLRDAIDEKNVQLVIDILNAFTGFQQLLQQDHAYIDAALKPSHDFVQKFEEVDAFNLLVPARV